jgi:hypothetical protein
MPFADPVVISAGGGQHVDRRVAPLPGPNDIGLEIVVEASVGLTHVCGLVDRPDHCSIVFAAGTLALPGFDPSLPSLRPATRLYDIYHPTLLVAAFLPSAATPDQRAAGAQGVRRALSYGVHPADIRFLFAQRLSWRMHLPVVVHIVSQLAVEQVMQQGAFPFLGQYPWTMPHDHGLLLNARDESPCDAATTGELLAILYTASCSSGQLEELQVFHESMRHHDEAARSGASGETSPADAPLGPRNSIHFNPRPQYFGSCDTVRAQADTHDRDGERQEEGLHLPLLTRFFHQDSALCRYLRVRRRTPELQPLTAVLGILSFYMNRAARDEMRTHLWRKAAGLFPDIRPVFLLDLPPTDPEAANATLAEAEEEGDIIFLPTLALGRAVGFGRKLVVWFTMVGELYPTAPLVAKIDDDTLPCIANFAQAARAMTNRKGLIWGWVHSAGGHEARLTGANIFYKARRVDEQFLVLSRDLASVIANIGLPGICDTFVRAYGGAQIAYHLMYARDVLRYPIDLVADWQGMCHRIAGPRHPNMCDEVLEVYKPLRVTPDFCRKHYAAHPSKDLEDVAPFYAHPSVFALAQGEGKPPGSNQ